jgi:hypothetical protein
LRKPIDLTDYISAIILLIIVYCSFIYPGKKRKCNHEYLFKYSLRPKITVSTADGIRSMGDKQAHPPSLRWMEMPISYSELNMFFSVLKISS